MSAVVATSPKDVMTCSEIVTVKLAKPTKFPKKSKRTSEKAKEAFQAHNWQRKRSGAPKRVRKFPGTTKRLGDSRKNRKGGIDLKNKETYPEKQRVVYLPWAKNSFYVFDYDNN